MSYVNSIILISGFIMSRISIKQFSPSSVNIFLSFKFLTCRIRRLKFFPNDAIEEMDLAIMQKSLESYFTLVIEEPSIKNGKFKVLVNSLYTKSFLAGNYLSYSANYSEHSLI